MYDKAASDFRCTKSNQFSDLDTKELICYVTLAASSHNSQPWKFRIKQNTITILPDYSRRCPAVDPTDSHLFKSLGCATENLVHAAAAQGYSSEVRFDPTVDATNIVTKRDSSAHATDLYHAITKRQCTKIAYDGEALTKSEVETLIKAGERGNVRTIMLLTSEQKDVVIDFVTRGNIAKLTDQSFRDELLSWIRFNPNEALNKRDGLSGRTNGQPSLPSWLGKLIIKLVLTPKGQTKTDATNIRSSAGVPVFVSSHNDKAAWVEVGRVYERFALQATVLNIRTAFINQPIEVPTLLTQFESWLNLNGEHALLMVRFGHGSTAPYSLRRPINDVLIVNN